LEVRDILEQQGKDIAMAITIVNGHAVCEEHRRRANYSFGTLVGGARKFLQDGPRSRAQSRWS
jgi:hypothetical protein